MAERQRKWARRTRFNLILELGGCCINCGCETYELLQFDHINPDKKGYETRRIEFSHRMSIYRKEAKQGKLQLLCKDCHELKTAIENRRRAA